MELTHTAVRCGRLSSFLREEMGISAGLMNRLKWRNKLYVNGIPQHTDYPVQVGDVITVPLDDPQAQYPAQEGALSILYEDAHLLAVDKPAGMLIHPSRSKLTDTLANFVLGYYKKTGQDSAFHPVTRLDRDTYGVVLLAKNAHIHALCNTLHTELKLEKIYHALVYGAPKEASGTICAPIARLPLPSLLRTVDPSGKECITKYQVLRQEECYCKLALQPVTGRTHQLRLHCAYMGFPILGDPQYGSTESLAFSRRLHLQSQLLCAHSISFPHPVTGQELRITSKLDASL